MNPAEAFAAVVVFGSMGIIGITLARAFAQRISGKAVGARELDALRDDIAQLRGEVADLHGRLEQMDELANRVDFAERVIAQLKSKPTPPALPGGA